MSYKRMFCTQTAACYQNPKWPMIQQVTKSNFTEELINLKTHISNSQFISLSLQTTGGSSSTWQRFLPFDTSETAYLKSKHAAERFQILQVAVCPFSVNASNNLIAHPYNFHLFPRDEFRLGMPSYTFSCQSSYFTSMAREGFDFNACIYGVAEGVKAISCSGWRFLIAKFGFLFQHECFCVQAGISYLSRAQESSQKVQIGHFSRSIPVEKISPVHSVADSIFSQRIKSRVINWVDACKRASNKSEDVLISSLRKLVSGSELYGSRPCLTIDVSSERQVQLALEMLNEIVDVVPIRIPAKGGGVECVRVVLTSSEEDRKLFEMDLRNMEEEQNKRVRGFREVVELVSTSQKLIIAHNSLRDFAFIYSKFFSSLPPTMDEFKSSLRVVFPQILDINHLVNEIGPYKKINNITATTAYLDGRFSAPVDVEIPNHGEADRVNSHGHGVLKICHLFVKLCSILKINSEALRNDKTQATSSLQSHVNMFSPSPNRYEDPTHEDVGISTGKYGSVSTNNVVFLWGFHGGISARKLKVILHNSHETFSENFEVSMVDKTSAVVVFRKPGFAERFLSIMNSGNFVSDKMNDLISEGMKATRYETYARVCELGSWNYELGEGLDEALEKTESLSDGKLKEQPLFCWNSDEIINLDEL